MILAVWRHSSKYAFEIRMKPDPSSDAAMSGITHSLQSDAHAEIDAILHDAANRIVDVLNAKMKDKTYG